MKKTKTAAISVAIVCVLFCVACFALVGCGDSQAWEVGSGNSTVTATLTKQKDSTYSLTLSGKGDMRSYSSASAVPWAKEAAKITSVSIGGEVTSIGSYAFAGADITSVVIPKSVTYIDIGAFDEQVAVFVYDKDIQYDDAADDQIYLYSEAMPKTGDRFWQSDMSKGDIFGDESELFECTGRYWKLNADGIAEKWDFKRVLFIGNSFTYRNGVLEYSSGVPGIFDSVAESLGYCVETYSVTGPGWYLDNHAKATDTCGKQIDKLLKARDDFDLVVLQEQSVNPFENYDRFLRGVKALQSKVNETQKRAQVYLYETWGSPYSANERGITVPAMELKLREAYGRAGEECGLPVSPIGHAFTDVYSHNKSINLYDTDNRHQGYTGAYLSACTHVGSMLGLDVRNTEFVGDSKYSAPTLSAEVLTVLRNAAYNAVFDPVADEDETSSGGDTAQYDLEVAVWGRWISEAGFVKLFDGFKAHCNSEGIDASGIHYTYYTGAATNDPYYYIASFTGAVVGAGGADVVFPCATNLTTQSGTQITSATITELNITLNGKTDRCVARLTDTELSMAFYNYCLSAEGKSLLAA